MHMKFISFIAGVGIILAGCTSQGHYPVTGKVANAGDSVRYMVAPDLAGY